MSERNGARQVAKSNKKTPKRTECFQEKKKRVIFGLKTKNTKPRQPSACLHTKHGEHG